MPDHICLLLDKECRITYANYVSGSISQATATALKLGRQQNAWGYEIWHEGRRLVSCYDCSNPPGRSPLTN